jgi:hypothetical protein
MIRNNWCTLNQFSSMDDGGALASFRSVPSLSMSMAKLKRGAMSMARLMMDGEGEVRG